MSSFQVISTTTIHAPNHSKDHTIHLTPWDLQVLLYGVNQKGLLYHHPCYLNTTNQIHHLKQSLSSTLEFFPPFAGRLKITEYENNTISCSILCNNKGALFVHAEAKNISVTDILKPTYLPCVLYSLFPLNKVKNYEGTSQPLLVVQVTELADGIFVGCTINHVVADGTSSWHFINSWAEISKGVLQISKIPSFERWFPKGTQLPIRFPFAIEQQNNHSNNDNDEEESLNHSERMFHFTKENIAKLKFKANLEAGTNNISSLQAVFTHIWRTIIRYKNLDPQEEVNYTMAIGIRPRFTPPLQKNYFGNGIITCNVSMKVFELLEKDGLGKGAWEMNNIIALYSKEKLKNHYENWLKVPTFVRNGVMASSNSLGLGSSPRFDVYGNDFGWGKPVGVRNGGASKKNGKVYVCAGADEGSMNFEVCLRYKILEVIGNDSEFMDFVSS